MEPQFYTREDWAKAAAMLLRFAADQKTLVNFNGRTDYWDEHVVLNAYHYALVQWSVAE